jgi:hypothetical protein
VPKGTGSHHQLSKEPMTRTMVRTFAILLPATVLAACELPFDRGGTREVGVVTEELLEAPYLEIPEAVSAGAQFEVTLTTTGPTGCYSPDGVRTQAVAGGVRITPYHRVSRGMCTQAPVALRQTVTLTAGAPGAMKIEIFARNASQVGAPAVVAVRGIAVQ